MPRYDGTGPAGAGPMTGRGLGYCVLKSPEREDDSGIRGYAGLRGLPVGRSLEELQENGKEAIRMPRGDGTGPLGMGPMTGRAAGFCAGYAAPGFMNPYWGHAGVPFVQTGYPARYSYGGGGMPFYGRGFPAQRFGMGFGRGGGRGRGRRRRWFWLGW
jgi:hypothetical protein